MRKGLESLHFQSDLQCLQTLRQGSMFVYDFRKLWNKAIWETDTELEELIQKVQNQEEDLKEFPFHNQRLKRYVCWW